MKRITQSEFAAADLSHLPQIVELLKGLDLIEPMLRDRDKLTLHSYEDMFQYLDMKMFASPFENIEHLKKCVVQVEKIFKLLQPEKVVKRIHHKVPKKQI